MKIEKLTENKIRIIISQNDLKESNTDLHTLMTESLLKQTFLLNILSKAEKEVGFNTDGCKLLIEASSSLDDVFVFTITKYNIDGLKDSSQTSSLLKQRKFVAKRKSLDLSSKTMIYSFANFDEFCDFCNYVDNVKKIDLNNISKNISLYFFNNLYYLVLLNINGKKDSLNSFCSLISEFGKLVGNSDNFASKLSEHGKLIIKKNAINFCNMFFANKT